MYSGVTPVAVGQDILDELYNKKKVDLHELPPHKLYENGYVILQAGSSSALTRVKKDELVLLNNKEIESQAGIKPRNKEQYFALDALLNPEIRVVTLTGVAGSGKSLMTLAAAVALKQDHKYKKIILTRPMSQVGNRELGILPGSITERFSPYLSCFLNNFECLFGRATRRDECKVDLDAVFNLYNIDIMPIQLMRGASFNDAFIAADEIQICTPHEMLTIGTRISEGSKLILMGDLAQRDEPIAKERTGFFKLINSEKFKRSSITAQVHLPKCERGPVSELFTEVFPEQDS